MTDSVPLTYDEMRNLVREHARAGRLSSTLYLRLVQTYLEGKSHTRAEIEQLVADNPATDRNRIKWRLMPTI